MIRINDKLFNKDHIKSIELIDKVIYVEYINGSHSGIEFKDKEKAQIIFASLCYKFAE